MERNRFDDHYIDWRFKRIQAIEKYFTKEFFKNKTLIELGAGYGDIGYHFSTLGSKVTCIEGRIDNIKYIQETYKNIDTIHKDLDIEKFEIENVDIIINMGLLYHLKDPIYLLHKSCKYCNYMIIETEVVDSYNPSKIIYWIDKKEGYDQSLHEVGTRISVGMVESILTENNFKFERLEDDSCNSGPHYYDWPIRNSGEWESGQRKLWFCEKKEK
jgi:hypothetical protein